MLYINFVFDINHLKFKNTKKRCILNYSHFSVIYNISNNSIKWKQPIVMVKVNTGSSIR